MCDLSAQGKNLSSTCKQKASSGLNHTNICYVWLFINLDHFDNLFSDYVLQAIYVFGFGVPLFVEGLESTQRMKWGMWIIHQLLIFGAYGFVLFVHFSGGKDKLPPRPAFYNYISMMFIINAMGLFACGVAAVGVGFGIWLYYFLVLCYHSLYLPFVYTTFLADFFQEEEFLLDNAYYSEMKDAGFFDADWE
ncbi:unnamed protein product [Linum tenue]|uniref:Cytochrome b n=1 Tax=Linum tenue TaxID=586396 RepID=A0AAV0LBD6_9ROSI|nr:unnamed protein product [Linum tenue]